MALNESSSSTTKYGLQDLPTEVLLSLFDYLDFDDLFRLSVICKRFYHIIKDDSVWRQRGLDSMVTNLQNINLWERSTTNLSAREKIRISFNWQHGKYKQNIKFDFRGQMKLMPCLRLVHDRLWLSRGKAISAFKRKRNRFGQINLNLTPCLSLNGHRDDVCRFVYDKGIIVSGGRDTHIYGFSADTGRVLFSKVWAHESDVAVLDFRDAVIVSSTYKDMCFKVWRISGNGDHLQFQKEIGLEDSPGWNLSIAFRPMADECIVGSCGHYQKPIRLYNLERGCESLVFNKVFRKGAGVRDISWETPHTVLTAGYDTYIRLWDCRTGNSELSWGDPFDSALYCLTTDKEYTMFSGTCNHNRVQLWDKRQTQSIQGYFLPTPYNLSCSIYSLGFDACCLYAGLDVCVSTLDFSGHNNKSRTYSNVWR